MVNNDPIIGNPYNCGGDLLIFDLVCNIAIRMINKPVIAPAANVIFVQNGLNWK